MLLEDILGKTLELRTDAEWGWRGEGFVRVDDGWVTIPGALPNENVIVEVEREIGRGRRTFAQLLDVVHPSPARTNSACPRVSTCGGCQLRHASPRSELEFKRERIRDIFSKFAPELEIPAIGVVAIDANRSDGYRWRSRLTFRPGSEPALGLVSRADRGLVPMADCPSLTQPAREAVSALVDATHEAWDGSDRAAVARHLRNFDVWAGEPAVVVVPTDAMLELPDQFSRLADALGEVRLVSSDSEETVRLPYTAGGMELESEIGAWVHATVEPAEALYSWLSDWLGEFDGPHVDVGCGVGAISLLASSHGRPAVGIDISRPATRSARRNLTGRDAEVITADWEKGLTNLAVSGARFESATLNPMREPMGERVMALIHRMVASEVLLLGPSPESAAKDAAELHAVGWRTKSVVAIDLHPASYQVMVGVRMGRGMAQAV